VNAQPSPRPWRTGTSPGTDGRTVYSPVTGYPCDKLIGCYDTSADAELAVKAVNAYGEPTSIEADLRAGWQQSERRRRIAAAVARHHHKRLALTGAAVLRPEATIALERVLAALGGITDPNELGIVDDIQTVAEVQAIVASSSGEATRG